MLIPISILWGTQMEFRRKFALVCIFSLVVITVVFSILRTSTVSALTRAPDPSWLYMWSAIEAAVGKLLQTIYFWALPNVDGNVHLQQSPSLVWHPFVDFFFSRTAARNLWFNTTRLPHAIGFCKAVIWTESESRILKMHWAL